MRTLAEVVADLLDESTQLEMLATLTTEILAHSPDAAAKELFRIIRTRPSETALRLIIPLLGGLYGCSDQWRRLIERSCKKRGRCPRMLRPLVTTFTQLG